MAKIDLGRVGAALGPDQDRAYLDLAVALEGLGFTTLSTGGPIESLAPFGSWCRRPIGPG